jgi:hypothetical protein
MLHMTPTLILLPLLMRRYRCINTLQTLVDAYRIRLDTAPQLFNTLCFK